MSAGDIFQVRALWVQPTTLLTVENSFYFKQGIEVLILDTPEEDLVQAFEDEALNPYQQCIHSNYGIVSLSVYQVPSFLLAFQKDEGTLAGGQGGDMMPPEVAGGLVVRSAHLGRRGRGRLYLGPPSESVNTSIGRPNSTETGIMTTFGDALLSMNFSTLTHISWEYGVWSNADQAFYPAVNFSPALSWWTQRGRKR